MPSGSGACLADRAMTSPPLATCLPGRRRSSSGAQQTSPAAGVGASGQQEGQGEQQQQQQYILALEREVPLCYPQNNLYQP